MKQIVAVDPGLSACGLAIFSERGYLEHAELARSPLGPSADLPARWDAMAQAVNSALTEATRVKGMKVGLAVVDRTLLVEMPKVYPTARQEGDQNDLMNLVGVVASVLALGCYTSRRILYPRDWKGTIKKAEMTDRIKGRLYIEETKAVRLPSAESLHHNVYDAIGIGLHAVGRLEPRKVIAR